MSIGLNDGLYIKYGGFSIDKIKKDGFTSIYLSIVIYCLCSSLILILIAYFTGFSSDKTWVFILSVISVCIEILAISLTNILQASNSMKAYSLCTFIDRSIYFFLVILLIVLGVQKYKVLILIDIISKLIFFAFCLIQCREYFHKTFLPLKSVLHKLREINSIGFSVALASYASKLINSITQFAIENKWGLLAFGKVALTLTISNAFSKFVNAVSLVLFPSLRNSSENTRIKVYNSLNVLLTVLMLAIFVFYLPIVWMLKLLLPNYVDSLRYIAILLPISLFETKVTMLVNTYLKVIRHEKEILFSNIIAVIISLIFAILSTVIFSDLDMTLISIVVVLSIRCYFAEYRLSKFINIKKSSFDILIMAAAFISSNWYVGGFIGTIMYIICLIIFILINKQNLVNAKENLVILSKK